MSDDPYRQVGEPRRGGIVCLADHASSHVPDDIELGIAAALARQRISRVDIGVEGVADRLARRHGIAAHIATVSRLVCDLHRREDEAAVVPDRQRRAHRSRAISARTSNDGWRAITGLTMTALARWLDDAEPALIVALHSFTPTLESDPEAERPWEVALLYNQDDRAARHAIRLFADAGLTVGDNEPYSGKQLNATMDRHAEAHGRPYLTHRNPAGSDRDQGRAGALGGSWWPTWPRRTALALKGS